MTTPDNYQVRELEVKFLKFIDKNWCKVQNEDEYKELEDNEKKELENAIKKIKPVEKIEKYVPPRSGHRSKFSVTLDAIVMQGGHIIYPPLLRPSTFQFLPMTPFTSGLSTEGFFESLRKPEKSIIGGGFS